MSESGTLTAPRGPGDWLKLWFLLTDPVNRRDYTISGFGLMAFKYLVEFAVVWQLTGNVYTPLDFVNPLMTARQNMTLGSPWLGFIWVLWALPFLWIAVGMSVRRALDAGISPWHGLWMFVPIVNLAVMLILAMLPTAHGATVILDRDERLQTAHRRADVAETLKAALAGIAVGALYASVLTQASAYIFHDYGLALFFGTPFIIGVASGYVLNLQHEHSHGTTMLVASVALLCSGAALLLFAVEGAICIAMAVPLILPLGIAGAPIGKLLADRRRRLRGGLIGALLVIPMWAAVEAQIPGKYEFEATSSIDIAAPPEVVWQNVVGFSKITERPDWIFRMGVACPSEARIFGTGVGAERHCIFTTGEFVEPITAWDEPRRLAFSVREQPDPMIELTPYRHIHPPHLDLSFRSLRGEFELMELPDGGTRLIGHSWYLLGMKPQAYWTIWSDWLVERIHQRVLRHIKSLSENNKEAG